MDENTDERLNGLSQNISPDLLISHGDNFVVIKGKSRLQSAKIRNVRQSC